MIHFIITLHCSLYKNHFFYRDIRDIDLYAGAMTELPVPGGMVGPTFACLIARQFLMYKKGDRFWYENNHRHGFTEGW